MTNKEIVHPGSDEERAVSVASEVSVPGDVPGDEVESCRSMQIRALTTVFASLQSAFNGMLKRGIKIPTPLVQSFR